ncbi:hypothetical protein [Ruegeria arenilitoris]|uniref:hypothetical protein n=1 Tax=Ruegeria arenilitoris TaxID=1173585 RepID=UPI00147EDA02|nr:hypothetical protein [Ruegeria arenilitoris]
MKKTTSFAADTGGMLLETPGGDVCMSIVGVVRNGGDALKKTISRIEELSMHLRDFSIVIATNDNSDDTDAILSAFSERCGKSLILRLDGLTDEYPERVERITVARNAVLDALQEGETKKEYTLVLDLDGPNTELDISAVLAATQRATLRWDAVFANPRPAYYDIYALRCRGWCEEDVWNRIGDTRKPLFGRRKWRRNLVKSAIYDRQFNIPRNFPLIAVDSAFAGAGLYRTKALEGLSYSCRDEHGRLVCEHVMLHKRMRDRGARLFIDPAFMTVAPDEHLGEGSGAQLPPNLINRVSGIY